jgi:hypothetical protein
VTLQGLLAHFGAPGAHRGVRGAPPARPSRLVASTSKYKHLDGGLPVLGTRPLNPPRDPGRKSRPERRQERRQSSGLQDSLLLRLRFLIPINDIVSFGEPLWADVLDTCIRRVATGPTTGRRLA